MFFLISGHPHCSTKLRATALASYKLMARATALDHPEAIAPASTLDHSPALANFGFSPTWFKNTVKSISPWPAPFRSVHTIFFPV
jgi:hypothetical protein